MDAWSRDTIKKKKIENEEEGGIKNKFGPEYSEEGAAKTTLTTNQEEEKAKSGS